MEYGTQVSGVRTALKQTYSHTSLHNYGYFQSTTVLTINILWYCMEPFTRCTFYLEYKAFNH